MSDLVFNGFKDSVKLMPITRALFYIYYEQRYIIIDQLEAESSYHISPILRKNHFGKQKTLGYNYDVNLYVPHNLYGSNNLLEELESLNSKELVYLYLVLGAGGSYVPPLPMPAINYNAKQQILFLGVKVQIEIESVEYRPRCIIRTNGFMKNLNNLFYQG